VNEIQEYILEWLKNKSKDEVFRKAQALGVPIAPTNTAKDVVESPQFNARNFFVQADHPAVGRIDKFPSAPYRFSKTPWAIFRPAPMLGQHNEEIFCDRLGFAREKLKKLSEKQVI
jgi:crotonobetainyl-CoA:carnitine CoA-transferase CaiB-like acyl-CoA transferase